MELVVWNSQGGKWDAFWTNFISPLGPGGADIMGLLVESGWAPWVTPGEVTINEVYPLETDVTWYNPAVSATSPFCTNVLARRRRFAYWVPWVKNIDAMKTNTRCSMGSVLLPANISVGGGSRYDFTKEGVLIRPVFRFDLSKPIGKSYAAVMSVFLVHLISGYPAGAQAEMDYLTKKMSTLIPQGSAAVIVGDMNINLLTTAVNLPNKWSIVNTGVATQQSGGELDYALLYDPSGSYGGMTAAVVQQYKSGNNQSDHSVMQYTIPIS